MSTCNLTTILFVTRITLTDGKPVDETPATATVAAKQQLEDMTKQHDLPAPIYRTMDSATKKSKGRKEFVCRVDVGNFISVTTYPSNYFTAELAEERGAEKALEALKEKITAMTVHAAPSPSNPNEMLVDSKSVVLDRIYDLVKDEPVGLLDVGLRDKYMGLFKQPLPQTWLETIENDGRFRVEVNKVYNRILTTISLKERPKMTSPLPAVNLGHNSAQSTPSITTAANQSSKNPLLTGMKIPDPVISVAKTPEDFYDVFVPLASSPSNFFVQPYAQVTEKNSDFQVMQRNMTSFYENVANRVALSPSMIERGYYAAAKVKESWRRVMIKSIVPPPEGQAIASEVLAFPIDFGMDIFVTSISSLQPLHHEFRAVPRLAINAELADIRPKGSEWTQNASSCFTKLVQNRALVSVVKAVKQVMVDGEQITKLSLLLIDTETSEDIYISNLLVDSGHADAV